MGKDRRRSLIVELLQEKSVQSQEEIAMALVSMGEVATQATVSRDLYALGASRGPQGYVITDPATRPQRHENPTQEVRSVVLHHVTSAQAAHSITVLRTLPGHAHMVASCFDRWRPDDVVGTVAGDDTIFLAMTSPRSAEKLAAELSRIVRGDTL